MPAIRSIYKRKISHRLHKLRLIQTSIVRRKTSFWKISYCFEIQNVFSTIQDLRNTPKRVTYQLFHNKAPPDFFRLLLSNCLTWKINCDDHSSLSSTTAVQI